MKRTRGSANTTDIVAGLFSWTAVGVGALIVLSTTTFVSVVLGVANTFHIQGAKLCNFAI